MDNSLFDRIAEKYPFLTIMRYAGDEHIGIVLNQDQTITTIYDYGSIVDVDLKKLFLSLGETWWWESNRSIPINIFLKTDWGVFKPYLKTFTNKNLEIISGPCTSLSDISNKKRKRKSITLVRRLD